MKGSRGVSTSFIISKNLSDVSKKLKKDAERVNLKLKTNMEAAINLIYRTATIRRPMINVIGSDKKGTAIYSKRKLGPKARRVSDPFAKLGVPVAAIDGGELKASIRKEVKFIGIRKVKGKVWTDDPIAEFLERGTSKMRARPFMRPALDTNLPVLRKIFNAK